MDPKVWFVDKRNLIPADTRSLVAKSVQLVCVIEYSAYDGLREKHVSASFSNAVTSSQNKDFEDKLECAWLALKYYASIVDWPTEARTLDGKVVKPGGHAARCALEDMSRPKEKEKTKKKKS